METPDLEMGMKGITCCADCAYYNMKKHKCIRATDEGKPTDHFYADCPLPDVTPKAQQSRVMELEEIKAAAFGGGMYWLEIRSICAPALMIEQKANYKIEFVVLHSLGYGPVVVGQFYTNEYKKVWRCWTSRPTDEQRESVPWNGCGDSCPIEGSDAD